MDSESDRYKATEVTVLHLVLNNWHNKGGFRRRGVDWVASHSPFFNKQKKVEINCEHCSRNEGRHLVVISTL